MFQDLTFGFIISVAISTVLSTGDGWTPSRYACAKTSSSRLVENIKVIECRRTCTRTEHCTSIEWVTVDPDEVSPKCYLNFNVHKRDVSYRQPCDRDAPPQTRWSFSQQANRTWVGVYVPAPHEDHPYRCCSTDKNVVWHYDGKLQALSQCLIKCQRNTLCTSITWFQPPRIPRKPTLCVLSRDNSWDIGWTFPCSTPVQSRRSTYASDYGCFAVYRSAVLADVQSSCTKKTYLEANGDTSAQNVEVFNYLVKKYNVKFAGDLIE